MPQEAEMRVDVPLLLVAPLVEPLVVAEGILRPDA
jgi:hypothetical protein